MYLYKDLLVQVREATTLGVYAAPRRWNGRWINGHEVLVVSCSSVGLTSLATEPEREFYKTLYVTRVDETLNPRG